MNKISYRGKQYQIVLVDIDDVQYVYAEESLYEAMEANNVLGCDLDNEICFYTTPDNLNEMEKIKENQAELIKFCNDNDIYCGEYTKE